MAARALAPTWSDLPGHAQFTDGSGWGVAQHYGTLKFSEVAERLFYVGRGAEEVTIASFDPASNTWSDHPGHRRFADAPTPVTGRDLRIEEGGWDAAKRHSTMQVVSMGNQLYLFGKGRREIHLSRFDPTTNAWTALPSYARFKDSSGWGVAACYSTIKVAALAGRLYVVGRGVSALNLVCFNPATNVWSNCEKHARFTDTDGWATVECYRTFRVVVVANRLYVFGRGADESAFSCFDPTSGAWSDLPGHVNFTDSQTTYKWPLFHQTHRGPVHLHGFAAVEHYSTIQAIAAGSKLWLFGRGAAGVVLVCYDPATNAWNRLPGHDRFSDGRGWGSAEHYSTLQMTSIGDRLFVTGRGVRATALLCFDLATSTWSEVPAHEAFTNAAGWDAERHFSTVKVATDSTRIFVIGRGAGKIRLISCGPL